MRLKSTTVNEKVEWTRETEGEEISWIESVNVQPFIVCVNPGETLYLPAGWFHEESFVFFYFLEKKHALEKYLESF